MMGFILSIAINMGVVKTDWLSTARNPASMASAAANEEHAMVAELTRPSTRIAKLKMLHTKMDTIETKMKEKFEILKAMNDELQQYAGRIVQERESLNSMSTMIFEIENERESLKQEVGLLAPSPKPVVTLASALSAIAQAARKAGVAETKVTSLNWKSREYLRLVDAFEFMEKSVYMRGRGMDKADALADAVEKNDVHTLTVVYRDTDKGGTQVGRERAYVLRNHLKETLGEDYEVKVSRISSDLVSPESVEVWVGQQ
jgi:myosin heavy subunit